MLGSQCDEMKVVSHQQRLGKGASTTAAKSILDAIQNVRFPAN